MCSSRWTVSAIVLFLFAGSAASASASPGLDVALLIDRSTSMAHRSAHQDLLLRMMIDLLARNGEANRATHRLAVIAFGSSATVDVGFTSVIPNDPSLRRRLAALHYTDRGDTDVLAAFKTAEEQFRALPAASDRRRAIVLLSDGVAFVHGTNAGTYRSTLRTFAETHFIHKGVTIDVLLLDSRQHGMWSDLARVTIAGSSPEQLLPQAHAVITRLAGTRTAESAPQKTNPAVDTLVVPPYLEIIVFDIFRASRDATVEIFAPRGTAPIRPGANGVMSLPVGDVLATLVVPRPAAGEWIIRKSRPDARVRVLSQQFFPRGALLRPAETETLRRCTRVPLAYRVLDARGEPLRELPEYTLALEVTLAKPNGASSTIAMEREPALGLSGFRSTEDPMCDIAGRYWTDVRVTALDAKAHRLEVFRDRWSGFSVVPADCSPTSIQKKPRP